MLASMTLGKKKRLSCELFYLLVRYPEVAGMLFEAPTLISFSVFRLFFFFLSVLLMSFGITIPFFLHFASIRGCVIILK